MFQFFSQPNIPFVKIRKLAYLLSIIVIAVGMTFFVRRGQANYGIDFTGGTLQQFQFTEPVSAQEVREVLADVGLGESAIQQFGEDRGIIIRSFGERFDEIIEFNLYDPSKLAYMFENLGFLITAVKGSGKFFDLYFRLRPSSSET